MEFLFCHHPSLLNLKWHLNLSSIRRCRLHRHFLVSPGCCNDSFSTSTFLPPSTTPRVFTQTSRFSLAGPYPSSRGFYLSRRRRPCPFFAKPFFAKAGTATDDVSPASSPASPNNPTRGLPADPRSLGLHLWTSSTQISPFLHFGLRPRTTKGFPSFSRHER